MRKLLIWLFGMCDHRWEERFHEQMTDPLDGDPIGIKYHLRCTKCGKMKFVKSYKWG